MKYTQSFTEVALERAQSTSDLPSLDEHGRRMTDIFSKDADAEINDSNALFSAHCKGQGEVGRGGGGGIGGGGERGGAGELPALLAFVPWDRVNVVPGNDHLGVAVSTGGVGGALVHVALLEEACSDPSALLSLSLSP